MKYRSATAIEPDLLKIRAFGEYDFEDLEGFIKHIKAEADRTGRDRVLIDCRNIGGHMTEGERFEGGVLIADVFGPGLKAALLMDARFVTKLGELAAVNRGAKFLVTSSEEEALGWLRSN